MNWLDDTLVNFSALLQRFLWDTSRRVVHLSARREHLLCGIRWEVVKVFSDGINSGSAEK